MNQRELHGQLQQLYDDLRFMSTDDKEQEVRGIALPALDAVLSFAREHLRPDDPLRSAVTDLISPEMVQAGEPVRAVDALVVVGQLVRALTPPPEPNARISMPRPATSDIRRRSI